MGMFPPHVYVIPEDRADEQIANGFVQYPGPLDVRRISVENPAGGWRNVLKEFEDVYIQRLRQNPCDYVVMLIDFDGYYEERRKEFEAAVPNDLKDRVFTIGPKLKPEKLKAELGRNYEKIGAELANECLSKNFSIWDHDHLKHNAPDRVRMATTIRSILFSA